MRKVLIAIIVIVVILIAAFVRISASRQKAMQREEATAALPVEVLPVSKGRVVSTCEVLGTVVADKTAPVFPETMGRVTKILVKEGTYVAKNANLMAIRNETIGFEYEEGVIKSPISGNIAAINVDIGSMVTPQTLAATIVDYATVKVEFNIAEVNIGCITRSRKVDIAIDGMSENFNAHISEVSPVIDPMTRTVAVKAVVSNPKKLLRPGMTARVNILLGEKEDALVVPKDALLDDHLFVVGDSTAERRDVVVGLIGDKNVEILKGLAEGERVVVIGQQRLAGGEKVNPILRGQF